MTIVTRFNDKPPKGETYKDKISVCDPKGMMTLQQQVVSFIQAGLRLEDYRRGSYDFPGELPEDLGTFEADPNDHLPSDSIEPLLHSPANASESVASVPANAASADQPPAPTATEGKSPEGLKPST